MADSRRSIIPQTMSELQLYRVLERANLLPYYSNFIHQGGDDVQQLCEAGEDEFLEIMSLVGMGSKPLHVRRLQKALQEWVANPGAFQEPLPSQQSHHTPIPNMDIPLAVNLQPHSSMQNVHHPANRWQQPNTPVSSSSPSRPPTTNNPTRSSPTCSTSQQISTPTYRPAGTMSHPSQAAFNSAPIGHIDNPILSRETVTNIRLAAEQLVRTEGLSPLPANKKITREVEYILGMNPDNPNRMDEICKWASIYGRFDSKRKLEKPLTLHEVTVNEAATQLCAIDPHLILQREKLFPMARQVVRDSGYQYKHGQSRSTKTKGTPKGESKSKRAKVSNDAEISPNPRTVQAEIMKIRREERMNEISTLLGNIKQQQYDLKAKIVIAKAEDNLQKVYDLQIELEKLTTQQLAYMTEQTDLIKKQKRSDRYYVAKAKAEGREGEDEDNSLLHDGNNSLMHDDQHQQQQQQQQQQQHTDPRSSSPSTHREQYGQANNSLNHSQNQHYSHTGSQVSRSSGHESQGSNQHYNPTDQGSTMNNGQYQQNHGHVEIADNQTDSSELSHTGLPKRAAYKAQRLMMQHMLMDEGLRVAQAYGEYRPPNYTPNINDGRHAMSGQHVTGAHESSMTQLLQ